MHAERFRIPEETVAAVDTTRRQGGRVVAVGTTVVRSLEAAAAGGALAAGAGETDIFIKPGHRFRVVDALLTNFHLPESTLLILVAAFAGRERVLAAYHHAIARPLPVLQLRGRDVRDAGSRRAGRMRGARP